MDRTHKLGIAGLAVLGVLVWAAVAGYVLTRSSPWTSSANVEAQQGDDASSPKAEDQQGDNRTRGHVNGSVIAKEGNTLTIRDAAGKRHTVLVTRQTRYQVRGHAGGKLADVTVGSKVRADGSVSGGVLTANLIKVKG